MFLCMIRKMSSRDSSVIFTVTLIAKSSNVARLSTVVTLSTTLHLKEFTKYILEGQRSAWPRHLHSMGKKVEMNRWRTKKFSQERQMFIPLLLPSK